MDSQAIAATLEQTQDLQPNSARREVVFVDTGVADYQSLVNGLPAGMDVVLLDARQDGLTQMADYLEVQTGIDAIHVLSHGASGSVRLGSMTLDAAALDTRAEDLARIGNALTADGDLLLYGCNVAQGQTGIDFIGKLARATGADVAASDDLTGGAAKGGDWVLEKSTGIIAPPVFNTTDYSATLASGTITFSNTETVNAGIVPHDGDYSNDLSGIQLDFFGTASTTDAANGTSTGSILLGDSTEWGMLKDAITLFPETSGTSTGNGYVPPIMVIESHDGSEFSFKSFWVANFAGGMNTVVVEGFRDGVSTGSVTLDSSDTNGQTFGTTDLTPSKFENVDEIRISNDGGLSGVFNDFQIGDAVVPATISISDATLAEGNSGTQTMLFTVTRTDPTGALTVDYATANNTATAGFDYQAASGTLSFADGQASMTISFTTNGDTTPEDNETFFVNLSNASTGTVTDGQGQGTIINDDNHLPTITAGGATTAFTEQTPVVVDSEITISDADGNADWNGGTLQVQITGNNTATDILLLPNSNPGGSAIWLNTTGNALMSGSTQIGTANASSVGNGTAWTFTFNASATNALVQATAQAVQFSNTSDDPSTSTRTVTFTATDKNAGSNIATHNVSVAAMNDAPTVSNRTDYSLEFSGNTSSYAVFPDVDNSISTAFTLEGWVYFNSLSGIQFIASGGTSPNNALNQLELHTNGSTLRFVATSNAMWDTGSVLSTGQWTHIAATYDASSDTATVYINGSVVSLTDGAPAQDSNLTQASVSYYLGKRSDSTYPLNGSIAEFRIWNDVRTADEIRNNMDVSLQGNEANLVSLWTLDEGNGTALNDSSTNNFDGTASNATWTTRPVSGGLAVNYTEDAAPVSLFSGVSVSTVESGQSIIAMTLTVTNVSDSTESLGIDGSTINLVDGSGTTATNGMSYTVSMNSGTATVTLSKPAGLTEAQTETLLNGVTYGNSSQNPSTGSSRVITLTSLQDSGGGSDTAALTLASTVTVVGVNDAPTLDDSGTPSLIAITEDNTANAGQTVADITGASISDVDSGAVEGIAITGLNSGNGTWQYSTNNGGSWTAVDTVAGDNALLLRDTDKLRFVPNGQNGTTGDITYRAWDRTSGTQGSKVDTTINGGTTAFSMATDTASITVSAVNDAPVLDNSGTPTLTGITEDDTNNTGQTVATIVGASIIDVDSGAQEGIAITGVSSGNGTWEYSTDNGGTWTAVGTVAGESALLLRGTDTIRFVPNGENATSASITYRAWDQTSGTAGNKVDTVSNGGTTAFSTATDTASITVSGVNDAPSDIALSASTASTFDVANYVVGTLSSTDVDTGDTHTYTLVSGDGDTNNGVFNINGNQLRLTTPSGLSAGTYSVRVRTTDNGTGNLTYEEAFTITVTDDLTVNTNSDAGADATTGGSYAAELADGGGLSLREALTLASAGGKTIGFAAGLTGQTITLGSAATVAAGITFDADAAGTLTISGDSLTLSGALTVTNGTGDALTIGSTLTGAGSLTKTGAGTLILPSTTTNTLNGSLTISGGTLAFGASGNISSTSGLTLDGGTLASTATVSYSKGVTLGSSGGTVDISGGSITLSNTISGGGTLTINSTAPGNVLSLSSTNSYSGGTVLNGGILQFGSDTAVGSGTLTVNGGKVRASGATPRTLDNDLVLGGTLTMSGSAALTFTGGVDLGGSNRTINNSIASTLTLSGVVSNGTLVIFSQGMGAVVLSGANTYAGGTTVSKGTLSVANDDNLGMGTVTLTGDSTLDITGATSIDNDFTIGASHGTISNANAVTLSGNISGSGYLTKTGTGILTLAGSNSYGVTTISAGTLSVASDGNLGSGQLTLEDGTVFQVTGATTIDNAIALTGNATIQSDAAVGISGAISGNFNLAKIGAGTLALSGTNTYGGTTTVSAGALSVAADANLGTGQINLASDTTLDITAATTIDNTIALTGNATIQADADATISGVISGSYNLTKTGSGTLTLSGTNTYSGSTTVSAGTLLVTGATSNSSGSFSIVDSGGTLGGTGTVGTLTVQSGGTLAPGSSAGTLATGNLVLDGTLNAELGGTTAGTEYDQVNVTGTVDVSDATLDLSLINSFTPSLGESFVLISNDGSDAITGTFTGLAEGARVTVGDSRFSVSYAGGDGNDFVLTAVADPLIVSDGGDSTAAINVAENTTAVTIVEATDADAGDTITYSITGGADQGKFNIVGATGVLTFASAPNYESPTDTGANNTYEVIVEANDGHGGTDTQAISITVTDAYEGPTETDGIAAETENQAAPLTGGTTGDGNGDGILDGTQSGVATARFLNTPTPITNPGTAEATYVTLVADSAAGKINTTDSTSSNITFFSQTDTSTLIPSGLYFALGRAMFNATTSAGATETFSFYVDPSLGVTGFWQLDGSGNWDNTASATLEGGKLRLDFSVTDGGVFDEDGTVNGAILAIGGLGAFGRVITGTEGNDSLIGTIGNDTMSGLGGNDTLNGGAGNDAMRGGAGNDFYVVDTSGDTIVELNGEGADTVQSSVTWTLGANLENLILTGTAAINGSGNAMANRLTGNSTANALNGDTGDDTLMGGAGNDTLLGGTGNDFLDGGIGDDSMLGGAGNDLYIVDSTGDRITETSTLATEIDTVRSSVTWQLGGNLENLVLTGTTAINGTGNWRANNITGNDAANTLHGWAGNDTMSGWAGDDVLYGNDGNDILYGNAGNDILSGGAGNDSLYGGAGNDIYVVDSTGDRIAETSTLATEIDTVRSSVTWQLAGNLENLVLTGAAAINGTGNWRANNITGNGVANTLHGWGGNDVLNGGSGWDTLFGDAGNDTLNGGWGRDSLSGGAGADQFLFTTIPNADNVDTITDFAHSLDKIVLDDDAFTALTVGSLTTAAFRKGAGVVTAGDADDRIILSTTTGALYYDADGNASGAAVQFATLTGTSTIGAVTAADFLVVA